MVFATFAEFVKAFGASRLVNSIDGSAVERQELVEGYLTTVSQQVASAAVSGGFDAPITGANLSPNDPAIADDIDQVFRDCTITMVSSLFLQPADETKRTEDARVACKDVLDLLKAGEGLPVTPPTRASSSMAVIQPLGAGVGVTTQGMNLARSAGV